MRKYIIVDIKAINLCQLHLFNTESINRWFGVNVILTVKYIYEIIHFWTAVVDDWLKDKFYQKKTALFFEYM